MWTYNYTDELYHHGIKGQKWGVRRYQNKDGSYTSAGKQKYYRKPKTNEKIEERLRAIDSGKMLSSSYRKQLENKYMKKKGYSREDARVKAHKKMKHQSLNPYSLRNYKAMSSLIYEKSSERDMKKGFDYVNNNPYAKKRFNSVLNYYKENGIGSNNNFGADIHKIINDKY